MSTQTKLRLCFITGCLAIANFVAFAIGAAAIGGDAVNGKIDAGSYFVADHGKLTEVSKAKFTYSRIHCYSVWFTHSLAVVSFLAARHYKNTLQPVFTATGNVL